MRLQPLRVTGKLVLTGQKDLKKRRSRFQKVKNKNESMRLKVRQKRLNWLPRRPLRVFGR